MAVEVKTDGFSSNLLVEDMLLDMGRELAEMPEGTTAGAAFIMTGPDNASASYGIEALEQAASTDGLLAAVYVPLPGAEQLPFIDEGQFPSQHFKVVTDPEEMRAIHRTKDYHRPNHSATLALTRWVNNNPDIDVGVPLLPAITPELDAAVRATISREKDADGIAPDAWHTPTTPEGMVAFANHILSTLPDNHPLRQRGITSVGELSPNEIAVYGFGSVVGQPLVERVLPAHEVALGPETIFKDRPEIEGGLGRLAMGEFSLVFTGYRAAGTMRDVPPNTIIIDVGNAIDPASGRAMGNVHPEATAESGTDGKIIARFIGGAGRVTIALVMQRAVDHRADIIRRQTQA